MAHKIYVEQEDGEILAIEISESEDDQPVDTDRDRESKGFKVDAIKKLPFLPKLQPKATLRFQSNVSSHQN